MLYLFLCLLHALLHNNKMQDCDFLFQMMKFNFDFRKIDAFASRNEFSTLEVCMDWCRGMQRGSQVLNYFQPLFLAKLRIFLQEYD